MLRKHYSRAASIALVAGMYLVALGLGLNSVKPKSGDLFAREGFVTVGLSWLLMSAFGALPFVFSVERHSAGVLHPLGLL